MGNRNTIELRLEVNTKTGEVSIRRFTGQGVKDLKQMEKQSVSMTKKMGSGLSLLRKHWLAYTAAMAGALYVAQRVIRESIKAASDLEEVQNKFDVVFSNQIELAEKWAETLRKGYLMSQREAKQYLASVQDLLVPMGMASDEAGKLSFEIVKLSADLGSFNNMPTAQVMENIQSALTGEYESMKKYGIILNATVVQERALAMGLAKTKDELTAAHKALAAYKIMVENSAAAIGDVERSYGSFANQQKLFKANIEDIHTIIGNALLPAATDVVTKMNEWVRANEGLLQQRIPEYVNRVTTAFTKLETTVGNVARFLIEIGVGETLFETKEEELTRKIKELEEELARLEAWEPNIINRIFGNTEKDIRRIEEIKRQLVTLRTELQGLGTPEEAPRKTTGPATTPPAAPTGPSKQYEKDLKKYLQLHEKNLARIKELTLEEKEFKLWQLERWYEETVDLYQRVGKDTTMLTRLYALERADVEKEFRQKQAEEHKELVDQWEEMEKSITRDLMTESGRRKAEIMEEFETRKMQLDLFLQKGIITEAAYTAAVQQAAEARTKKIQALQETEKTYLDYIEEMNKQTALNVQQSWSGLLSGVMKNEFKSVGDWFNSFLNSLYDTWADTLSKMAYKWVNDFIGQLTTSSSGTSGKGGFDWGGLLSGLLSGLVGALQYGGVIYRGRILPFGRGTIVTGPTLFPMADGNFGLMGEKSWEAVMPLARTPKGELGVKTTESGGRRVINGPLVQFNITTPDVSSFNASKGQLMTDAYLAVQRGMRGI